MVYITINMLYIFHSQPRNRSPLQYSKQIGKSLKYPIKINFKTLDTKIEKFSQLRQTIQSSTLTWMRRFARSNRFSKFICVYPSISSPLHTVRSNSGTCLEWKWSLFTATTRGERMVSIQSEIIRFFCRRSVRIFWQRFPGEGTMPGWHGWSGSRTLKTSRVKTLGCSRSVGNGCPTLWTVLGERMRF